MRLGPKSMSVLLTLAAVMLLSGGATYAQTADGQTPAEEVVCDHLSGAAYGLCTAYCEAMDCELLDDGDDTTSPNASEKACLRVKNNFIKITGEASLPCDICPPDAGQEGCPCTSDFDCAGDLTCDAGLCTTPEQCPPGSEGTEGCPCVDDPLGDPFCFDNLACNDANICVVTEQCPPGTEGTQGCPCIDDPAGAFCLDGLACSEDNLCVEDNNVT